MAGMNLLDMIMAAQGGKIAKSAGGQFGLNAKQSQSAIAALLPAISSALKKNTASPQGMAGLLGALQNNDHGRYMDNPDVYSHSATRNEGNNILGHLFGSKDVSRAVAGHAAKQSGIGADILKKMLPMVATMAMGSLSKQTAQPSMASQLAGLALGGGRQQTIWWTWLSLGRAYWRQCKTRARLSTTATTRHGHPWQASGRRR